MLLRLNANQYRGFLYKFVDSLETVDKILHGYDDEYNGQLRPGISFGWKEGTWDTDRDPKIRTDVSNYMGEHRLSQFSSWTRNPYGIIEQGVDRWKYAVIIDGSKVDDSEIIKPMNYGSAPNQWHVFKIVHVPEYDPGSWSEDKEQTTEGWKNSYYPYVKTRGKHGYLPSNKTPAGWYLYYLNRGINSEKYTKITEDQVRGLLQWYEDFSREHNDNADTMSDNMPSPSRLDSVSKEYDKESWHFAVYINKDVTWNDVPGILWRLVVQSFPQSEERFYETQGTRKRQGSREKNRRYKMDVSKAIWGILIPDVEYFNEDIQDWIKKHSNLQVRIYRDKLWNPASDEEYQEFKDLIRLNPEVKKLYKLPG